MQSDEAKNDVMNKIVTKQGEWFWPYMDEGYETSMHFNPDRDMTEGLMHDVMRWATAKGAAGYAKRLAGKQGHPWYFLPNGNYKVIKLKPQYKLDCYMWDEEVK